ncbi:MAG: hypothetical protein NZ746_11035 [Blastocatellia bacterium]|nr:hypothetical protein [Blastocatellia bacterium]MDW8256622.1 hypothetical protein [Acidobacteriota bacterium]
MKRTALALALIFAGPSLGQVQKYGGTWGLLLYVLSVFGFWGLASGFLHRWGGKLPERWIHGFAAATGSVLLLAFLVLYPLADSGIIGGGSDRDDALNLGVGELLHGRCPYHVTTYLGNPIAPLPGGLFLSLPFVLLGNSAYQNFFWLAIFFFLAHQILREGRQALLLLWSLLAFSPVLLQQIITGGDLPANSIAVLVFSWLLIGAPERWKWAAAPLLGLGLAWRVHFLLLLPLLFALLRREVGGKMALGLMGLVLGTFSGIVLPFARHAPHGVAPFLEQNKFARFDEAFPHVSLFVLLAAWGYAFIRSRASTDVIGFFRESARVLAFPIACGLILATLRAGQLDVHLADYGVSFLFFGALAWWKSFVGELPDRESSS